LHYLKRNSFFIHLNNLQMKQTPTRTREKLLRKARLLAVGIFAFAFQDSNAQTTFNYTGSLQTYTVPAGVTSIRIDGSGAQGGSVSTSCAATGGLGARMVGDFSVTPGEVLSIMVGQQGLTNGSDAGGGGGTFVVRTGNVPLIAAGGGGGATNNIGSCGANRNGINATITTSGTASGDGLVAGGTGGNGGGASTGSGGGGGGFYTDGVAGTGLANNNGKSYLNNGVGGTGNNNDFGGYGGGGAGWFTGGNGGGGGGYSGGATSGAQQFTGGGGGGSYNAGTNQTNTAGFQSGNGRVIITVLFSATITQNTSISCNGQSTGSLTAAPVGGTAPFTYSWAPTGGTAATASGLSAGTYTVTITDANMSTTTQTFTITQPTALVATTTHTNVSCNGSSNGSGTISISGGTPGYTYSWAPSGGTAATASNLMAGTYTCTVTDANGCTTSSSITITQPSAITASATQTNVLCNGGNNGSATVTVTGGTPGYTYSWSPSGGTAATASNLSVGTYTCTITDANGCTTTSSAIITQPTALSSSVTQVNVSCNGGTNGSIDLTVTGGTGPYTYNWNSGAYTVEDPSGLPAGTYTGVVTDANGCTDGGTVVITQPPALASSVTQVNVSCNGGTDGSIDLTVTGGTGPYTYNWNSGAYTVEDPSGLPAGSYAGVVTDANGCTTGGTVIITQPTPITAVVATTTNPTTCGGTDGTIDIAVTGGTPVYTYSWSNSATTEDIAAVGAGTYTNTITDSNGCTTTITVTLVDPTPPTVSVSLAVDTVCVADGAYVLSGGSPAGGTYSGPGVTTGSFNPTTAGLGLKTITYSYTDPNTGCSATSTDAIFVDACTGIVAAEINNNFTVMPNPNNGTFTLQLNTTKVADVMIYDALGQLVSTQKVEPNVQQQLSVDQSGVYLVVVMTADGQRTSTRVVVSK
jgi:hypothetical protein